MPSLVIVESPAKARTISRFLGGEYVVEASIGAIRDLEPKGLAVDVDHGFTPTYVVPAEKRDVVRRLKAALREADDVFLATDEDREGEAIAWHLAEVLKPRVPTRRMVFHEITRQAIEAAVERSRDIDGGLVDAQETRRIVDRLFGYPVSELLWRKVATGLSAGRVQSPAIRLVVERERERMAFVAAGYWDLVAAFPAHPAFPATLVGLDDHRVATGRDFDGQGRVTRDDVVVLDEVGARALVSALEGATFTVGSVEERPYRSSPKPPFITSTLQQEGGRKLGMSSSQVMRTAQSLYERGYITYMRTDSVALSEEALAAARAQVRELYGDRYLPDAPRTYRSKVKNAQEAHEAIRPAGDRWRTPQQVAGELRGPDLRIYDLIWKRTLASQMTDAVGKTVTVRIEAPVASAPAAGGAVGEATVTRWSASGRTITFPGYLRVYVEGSDDPDADLDDRERLLPELAHGDVLPAPAVDPVGHTTQPPARYTEASLVKRLEELGIGRPSTYASIMQTIQNRGYVWKRGQALVPSWSAFAVVQLLESHFAAEVDYSFTARMESDLDEIAAGTRARVPFLEAFWFGTGGDGDGDRAQGRDGVARPDDDGSLGLSALIELAMARADPAVVNAVPLGKDPDGTEVFVRNGRYGPYVKRGEDTAAVPEGLAPDELTVDKALELLSAPKGDEPLGVDPASGLPVYAKSGRFGPYVQLGDADTLPAGEKPKRASLFKDMSLTDLGLDDALRLLGLPRTVGTDPETGEEILALNGRYGPYLKRGDDTRSLASEHELFTVSVEDAKRLFAEPKRRGRQAAAPPLRTLGEDPATGKPMVVKNGRYGPYVTDGETNASLRERDGDTVEGLTDERAAELLQARRDAGPARGRGTKKATKGATKKRGTTKKAATTKNAAKKATATKKAAKKATAKKATAKKRSPTADAAGTAPRAGEAPEGAAGPGKGTAAGRDGVADEPAGAGGTARRAGGAPGASEGEVPSSGGRARARVAAVTAPGARAEGASAGTDR
ncbi:MAG TPA: type I DNA topoisomerase [Acidimicrobiales bacterium]|nr:type I DNA topoisomerase [Acidimicrobiales bacterium]